MKYPEMNGIMFWDREEEGEEDEEEEKEGEEERDDEVNDKGCVIGVRLSMK